MEGLTEGIVLEKINYSETSVIMRVLTPTLGVQSFMFRGAKRKNKKGNLISPLAILHFEYYQRGESELYQVKAIEPAFVYSSIPYDPYKSSVVFFMNEVLSQTIRFQTDTHELFLFLKSLLQILDLKEEISELPVYFLFELTRYLGFYPKIDHGGKYFDLQEGKFVELVPRHTHYLSEEKTKVLLNLANAKFDASQRSKVSLNIRRELIHDLLNYYNVLFENFKPIKSLAVLEAVLHD